MKTAPRAGLELKLRALKLPSFVAHHGEMAGRAETGGWRFDQFLDALADLELEERTRRRIARVLKASHLPADKTLATLDLARLVPGGVPARAPAARGQAGADPRGGAAPPRHGGRVDRGRHRVYPAGPRGDGGAIYPARRTL